MGLGRERISVLRVVADRLQSSHPGCAQFPLMRLSSVQGKHMSNEYVSCADKVEEPSPFEHILFPRAPIHEPAGQLARFLAELRFEDLPTDVLHTAKLVTLDTIGCIVAGTRTPLGRKIVAAYGSGSEANGCSIPGTSLKLAPSVAAKVNGWLSDVLDFEDTAAGHPSATVIPAALAMAEHLNSTPKQFLLGVVAGYEAGLRLYDATRASPEAYRRFASYHAWHGVAAGAAAMVVSGGSEEQFRSALGHAAANTNIPLWYVQYGRPAHALKANYGQMALGGVDAAICARQDIVGPFAMLSDPVRGFAAIIGSDQFDPSKLSVNLGKTWRLRGTSFKGYPACYSLHSIIDAVSSTVKNSGVEPEQIEKISVRCSAKVADWFSDDAPATDLDGQFSVQYVTAMSVLSIEPGTAWYEPSTMNDPVVSALMKKTKVEVDPRAEDAFWNGLPYLSTASLLVKDGRSFSATVEWPTGHPNKPLSDADLERKFLRNLRGTSLEKHGAKLIEEMMNIDRSTSLSGLGRLLSTP